MEMSIVIAVCVVLLVVQLLLCFKVKGLVPKLIPSGSLLAAAVLFIILMQTASGWSELAYLIFAMLSGIFLIPCAIGWVIWGVSCFIQKKKEQCGE